MSRAISFDDWKRTPAPAGTYDAGEKRRPSPIKEWRLKAGLSLRDAARNLGVMEPWLNAVERGERTPRLAMALKLCALYGCSAEDLMKYPA